MYTRNVMGNVGTAMLYRQAMGERKWARAYKFCFVRNPWDRAVSIWRFLCLGHAAARLRNFGMDGRGLYGYGRNLGFREFLEGFEEPNLWEWWHMTTQEFHIVDSRGEAMVDFIGRFERLQEDFDKVCARIGMVRMQLPHENRTDHAHYSTYYDLATTRLVEQRYGSDIERFGYRFGD